MSNDTKKYTISRNINFLPGVHRTSDGYTFTIACDSNDIMLYLFKKGSDVPEYTIPIGNEYKTGNVFSVNINVCNTDLEGFSYVYMADGRVFVDPYAKALTGVLPFSVVDKSGLINIRAVITNDTYDWKGDRSPDTDREDLIIYKLHPRGFTMSPSSKVKAPGTFRGIMEKCGHFKKLGINAVMLMPAYEFNEYDYNFNYWGYSEGFYFAPKSSYSSIYPQNTDYTSEFKDMVRKLHSNSIEVYMEFYFPGHIYAGMIDECLRFWKNEYHIDGAHLICDDRIRLYLAKDPFLKDFRLIYTSWDEDYDNDNLFEYNEEFQNVTRRFLKGDEGQLRSFVDLFKKNPRHDSVINYITDNNGFTLMDLVSYDRKHNEDNGECNRDGKDYNMSWNCGEEGESKTRRVLIQRMKSRKNAMAFMLLSQGIPLIYSGDEFGNSQNGNNNAYCQDNEIGWLNWNVLGRNRRFFNYVAGLIAFRKSHQILHMEKELFHSDYKYYGFPDISFHGSKAWYPEYEYYMRHIGIMLCGRYAGEEENVYIGINMHWEKCTLALPKVPDSVWDIAIKTSDTEEAYIDENRLLDVPPRSIVVLVSIRKTSAAQPEQCVKTE